MNVKGLREKESKEIDYSVYKQLFGDICCKKEQRSQAIAAGAHEVKRNGRHSSILCANGSDAQHPPLLPPSLQWLSHCFLTFTRALCSLYSKYTLRIILLNKKPNNVMPSSHHI